MHGYALTLSRPSQQAPTAALQLRRPGTASAPWKTFAATAKSAPPEGSAERMHLLGLDPKGALEALRSQYGLQQLGRRQMKKHRGGHFEWANVAALRHKVKDLQRPSECPYLSNAFDEAACRLSLDAVPKKNCSHLGESVSIAAVDDVLRGESRIAHRNVGRT
jgi:hypothetical protein